MTNDEIRKLTNAYKWQGWARADYTAHAIKLDGSTVCGAKLECRIGMEFDYSTACPECLRMIYKGTAEA